MVVAEVGPQLPGHPPPPLHHYQLLLLLMIQSLALYHKEPHTGGGSVTGPPTAWVVVQKKWGKAVFLLTKDLRQSDSDLF